MTVKVELFTATTCRSCASVARMLAETTAALGADMFDVRVVDVVEEIDYAVSMGVLSTPSIAVAERLIFTSVPRKRQLKRELEKYLRLSHAQAGFRDG